MTGINVNILVTIYTKLASARDLHAFSQNKFYYLYHFKNNILERREEYPSKFSI